MRTLLKSAGASALACGALGFAASAASGAAAQQIPAQYVPVIAFPAPAAAVGASVGANCPSWVANDDLGLQFTSGNAVEYRIDPSTGQPNGGNAEGQAYLEGVVLDKNGNVASTYTVPGGFSGHTHVWFGSNTNPNFGPTNDQNWFGETVSFNGTSADGMSGISISASFGGGNSASGNSSGWLHVKVTCTGNVPSS